MPNKIIKTEKGVDIRIDEVYTNNEKHFFTPFVKADGTEKYFGSFKFLNLKDAKQTMKDAVRLMESEFHANDTVFEGAYPKWIEDNYGTSLQANGRVRFFKDFACTEAVPEVSVKDYVYSLEIHLTKTLKDDTIYLRVARAIVLREAESKYNQSLYEGEEDLPF